MSGSFTKVLVDAVVSGLPLGLVVAIVLAIAGVPTDLLSSAALVAFGVGFSSQLLSRKGFGVRLLGGVVALVVLAIVVEYWNDWSRFLGDSSEYMASREGVVSPALPAAPVRWPGTGSAATPAGGAGSGSAAPARGGSPGRAPAPTASGGRGSAPTSAGEGGSIKRLGSPGPGQPGDAVPERAEVARVLLVRNPLDIAVEVGITGTDFEIPPVVLESGDSTELDLGEADPSVARLSWRWNGDRYSTPWVEAALGGGPFDIPATSGPGEAGVD